MGGGIWVVLLLLACQSQAHAHMIIEGAGEILSGAVHPLMTPSHLIILLGLCLLLGQRLPLDVKTPLWVLAPASAVGLLVTLSGYITVVPVPLLAGIALALGAIVAWGKPTPAWLCRLICAVAGVAIGLDSGVDSGTAWAIFKTLAGTWLSLNLVVAYLTVCVSHGGEKPWARTGIRVLGSWIFAISLLLLAFALRK